MGAMLLHQMGGTLFQQLGSTLFHQMGGTLFHQMGSTLFQQLGSTLFHQPPLGDKVSMLTHIYPHKARRKIEVIICKITRLTAHFMCGLMSDLLICTCL